MFFYDINELLEKERDDLDRHKIEAIGHIAGNVARNYKDWLGIVAGHASAIADNLIPETRAHEEAMKMLDATKMAGRISNQLESIARASDASIEIKIGPVAMADVVRKSVNTIRSMIGKQKIEFKIRNPEQMPHVMADAAQLPDCLMNLLLNSVEAMPDGGTITVDTVIKIDGNKDYVVLRVRDAGCGMTKEVIERMYEPFFTTKKRGSALGLGLTVVQSSVQQWNGYIKARSQPGHGSSFRVFIPRARIRVAKDAKKSTRAGAETILVVDDNEQILAEARSTLRDAGYRVFAASSGEECISLYKRHATEINLLIIDVVMPGHDGKEVLKGILEIDPTAHIIMTSGFSRDYVRTYLERGEWGFVQKPYAERHLLSVVRGVLDREVPHSI
jgi:nitrogen-specific signal transduction histidine kinase/CheY-like chemotaxis protein